jgi:hypothetical protein
LFECLFWCPRECLCACLCESLRVGAGHCEGERNYG